MSGPTTRYRTDEGLHLVRYVVAGEIDVIRRDDLRGVWEVEGDMFSTREEAIAAAEDALNAIEATQ